MTDQGWEQAGERIGEAYNPPPEVPREAMWAQIEDQLPKPSESDDVVSLAAHRASKDSNGAVRIPNYWRRNTLIAAAAGLVLWVGFGLGRATTPEAGPTAPIPQVAEVTAPARANNDDVARFAATRHLAATRTLLTTVGSNVESGSLDPNVASLATLLLTQTRLMLDSPAGREAEMTLLLEDLELILIQVVHASNAGAGSDTDVSRMELQQLTQGLQDNDVLPRIQQLLPPVMAGAADD